jgi:hypothetical protein
MPDISIHKFRGVDSANLDSSIRLDSKGENVTSAARGLGGRIVRLLKPSKLRQENLQVAQQFLGALKKTYGQEIANQVFKSIRQDASFGEDGKLVFDSKKALTARDIKLALSSAEAEKIASSNHAEIISEAQDYFAGSEKFGQIAKEISVDPSWSSAQQQLFNQRVTSAIKDLSEKNENHPLYEGVSPRNIEKAVKQAIIYVDGLKTDEIANKQLLFSEIGDQGQALSKAILSGKNIAESFGALVFKAENLTKDAALGVDIQLDNDILNDARNTVIREAVESIPPREAAKILETFNKPGTQARSFLLALGVNTGQASFKAKELDFLANTEVTTTAQLFLNQLGKRANQPELANKAWAVYDQGFNATTSEAPLPKDELSKLLKDSKAGGIKAFAKQAESANTVREQRLSFHETNRIIQNSAATKTKPFLPESGATFAQFAQEHNVSASEWSGAKVALYRSRLAETVREDTEESVKPKTADEEGLQKTASKVLRYIDRLSNEEAESHLQAWGELRNTGLNLANALADQADAATISSLLTSYVNQRNALAPDIVFEAIDARIGLGGDDRSSLSNQAIDSFIDHLSVEDAAGIANDILRPNSVGRALIIASNLDLTRRGLTADLDTRSSSLESASRSTSGLLLQITQRLAEKGNVADGREQVRYLASDLYSRAEADVTNQEFINSEFKPQFFEKAQISPELLGDALGTYDVILEGQLNTARS